MPWKEGKGGKIMKTAEEFYKEIETSKDLREELKAVSDETLEAFLKKHGCNATAKEFTAFIRPETEGELEDDGLGEVNGGIYHQAKKLPTPNPML